MAVLLSLIFTLRSVLWGMWSPVLSWVGWHADHECPPLFLHPRKFALDTKQFNLDITLGFKRVALGNCVEEDRPVPLVSSGFEKRGFWVYGMFEGLLCLGARPAGTASSAECLSYLVAISKTSCSIFLTLGLPLVTKGLVSWGWMIGEGEQNY